MNSYILARDSKCYSHHMICFREAIVQSRSIKDILKGHINDVMSLEDGRNYVNVRRGHVLEDAVAKIQKKKFNPKFPISIKFADDEGNSEGAVDTGGPT